MYTHEKPKLAPMERHDPPHKENFDSDNSSLKDMRRKIKLGESCGIVIEN